MQVLVSKKEISERAKVSQTSITKACKGVLKAALVGDRLDLNHPDVKEYIELKSTGSKRRHSKSKGAGAPTKRKPVNNLKTTTPSNRGAVKKAATVTGTAAAKKAKQESVNLDDTVPIPENLLPYVDLTLRELIEKFGTSVAFSDWLKSLKAIEDIEEKRLKNRATRGELIDRDFVKIHVFGNVEDLFSKLLNDSPSSLTSIAVDMVEAGETKEEITESIYKSISTLIKNSKSKILKALKNV